MMRGDEGRVPLIPGARTNLWDDAHLGPQVPQAQRLRVHAVNQDAARLRLHHPAGGQACARVRVRVCVCVSACVCVGG